MSTITWDNKSRNLYKKLLQMVGILHTAKTEEKATRSGKSAAPLTESQIKFQEAVAYANRAMADPVLRSAYATLFPKRTDHFNIAKYDALSGPVLDDPMVIRDHIQKDLFVRIAASDNVAVDKVRVQIKTASGKVREEGDAEQGETKIRWDYITDKSYSQLKGCTLTVTAYDLAGNQASREIKI